MCVCVCVCVCVYIYMGWKTCLWIHTLWIYSLINLENTDANRISFVRSLHHKYFGKAQHLVLWALWWHQLFSTRWSEPHWWVLERMKHVSVDIYALNLFIEHFENTDENRIFFIHSPHHKHFGKPHWWVLRTTKHVSVDIYALNLFIGHSGEHWWEQNIICSFITPKAFWWSSAPGTLSILVTSVVLY